MLLGCGASAGFGQEQGFDVVIIKNNATPPDFAAGREFKCRVLDSDEKEFSVELVQAAGVPVVKKIAKSLVGEIRFATPARTAYFQSNDQIRLPKDSRDDGYYDRVIADTINPLLEKFPGTDVAALLSAAAGELRQEQRLVRAGWVRRGKIWYTPEETGEYANQQELRQLLGDLRVIQDEVLRGQYESFGGLAERVGKFKNNAYYPYLLEGVQVIIRPARNLAPPELLALGRQNSATLTGLARRFQKIRDRLDEIQAQQLTATDLFTPLVSELAVVAKGWPELEGQGEFAEQCLGVMENNLWLAALQTGQNDGDFTRIADQARILADCGAISLTRKQEIQTEATDAAELKKKLRQLREEQKYQELADVPEPQRVAAFAPAHKLFAAVTDEARARVTESDGLFAQSQAAYEARNWAAAAAELTAAFKSWPKNPQGRVYFSQLTSDFTAALADRKEHERARHILLLLRTGWPETAQLDQFEQDLEHTQSWKGFMESLSKAQIAAIVGGVVALLVALKLLGKLLAKK
jgi:hypothetical protein